MRDMRSFFSKLYHSPIPRRAAIMVPALAWTGLAFCGEIHDVAKSGNLERVKALLKDNPDLVSSKDKDGATPLYIAATSEHNDIAELLLAKGADVNAKDKYGNTALIESAYRNAGLVKALIGAGVDVNAKLPDGWTALMRAADLGHADIVKALIAAGAKEIDGTSLGQQSANPKDGALMVWVPAGEFTFGNAS
jgi:ankyrin repeat protein